MTDDRSLERAARSWLEEGPTQAPDRAVEAALARIQTTTQERDLRIPWRLPSMNPVIRLAAVALIAALAVGGALYVFRPASQVGPPAPSPQISQAPPSIEGTWDVSFTRAQMLARGAAQGEDDPSNYGHFHLTLEAGRWQLPHLDSTTVVSATAPYTLGPGVVHLYLPADGVTFDLTYTVTATSLTFGDGGPVTFRVKPWTRVATEPLPPAISGAGPLKVGTYDGPTVQVADIEAAANADTTLSPADRAQVINLVQGGTTWSETLELFDGQMFERQVLDGNVPRTGTVGRISFPDANTLVYTESLGTDVVTQFQLSIAGDTFTLRRTTPAQSPVDAFITRHLFESGPFALR